MGIQFTLLYFLMAAAFLHFVKTNLEVDDQSPLVRISQGLLIGRQRKTFTGRKFLAFRGIPYATPPLGFFRFKAPEPPQPWKHILEAGEPGPICPQMDFSRNTVIGQEDCLYLNVYTPKIHFINSLNHTKKYPVMVWIHGGGFLIGDSTTNTGPRRMLDKDIVLVSINYRLGALGFLSTNDEVSPGNFGLWDQTMALQWIQENIEEFGGDPHLVTLFGESSGAASVGFHLISSASAGLFHRVILHSGSPICHWAVEENPFQYTLSLADQLNCSTIFTDELIHCLRNKSIEDIVKAADSLSYKVGMFPLGFVPVIEQSMKRKFLEDHPINLLRRGKVNRVPVISGFTEQEGIDTVLAEWEKMNQMQESELAEFVDQIIVHFGGETLESIPQVKELYMGTKSFYDMQNRTFIQSLIDIVSDGVIKACHQLTVQLLIENEIPTYEFRMDHEMKKNLFTLVDRQNFSGAAHGEELLLFFDSIYYHEDLEGNDKILSENAINIWTNFAKYGDPTPPETNNQFELRWSPATSFSFLSLQVPLTQQYKSKSSRFISFWIEQMLFKQSHANVHHGCCSSDIPFKDNSFNKIYRITNYRTYFERFSISKDSTCKKLTNKAA